MAESCGNCGAELFTGQQFCRLCGTPTRTFSSGEIPTQILPGGGAPPPPQTPPQTSGQPGETTPLSARDTADPVYRSRYAGYQPPADARPQAGHAGGAGPGQRRSRRGLAIALLSVLVVSVGASVYLARRVTMHWVGKKASERQIKVVVPKIKAPQAPDVPGVVVERREADEHVLDEPLDEEGAEVTGGETVITRNFPLEEGKSFAVTNVAGDISVEGWDGEGAEVKITKRGGTPDEREGVEILHSRTDKRLLLTTKPGVARGVRDVRYEIKLPRGLRQVDIVSTDSNVEVSGLAANVGVVVMRGNISLEGVSGTLSTRTTKGNTEVALPADAAGDAVIVDVTNGSVEIKLPPGEDAEIKAETVKGRIEADAGITLNVERRLSGEHAVGRVGKGGRPIILKTVSGDIRIK